MTAQEKKSKRSLYWIDDEFLRFWFRFVEPNQSGIEQAPQRILEHRILPEFDRFVAATFEDVCREVLWRLTHTDRLHGSYGAISRWWYGEQEIDLVALDDRTPSVLFGECKWTTSPVGTGLVEQLQEKATAVRWKTGAREEEFAVFSKAGFEDGLSDQLGDRWHLFDLPSLSSVFEADGPS